LTAEPNWRAVAVLSLYLPFALLAADSLLFFWWLLRSRPWRGRERALVRRYAGRDMARGAPGSYLLWVAGLSAVGLLIIGHTANVATSAFQRGGVSRLARPVAPGDAVGLAAAAAGAAVLLLLLAAKPPGTSWAMRLGVAGALALGGWAAGGSSGPVTVSWLAAPCGGAVGLAFVVISVVVSVRTGTRTALYTIGLMGAMVLAGLAALLLLWEW
jgi:hypothetical protein